MDEKYSLPILMTEDELDEYDDEELAYTEWDIADAAYNGQRAGISACIQYLRKWQSGNPAVIEAIKMLEQL